MTITLNPDQERAIRDAIRAGRLASVAELIDRAIAELPPQTCGGEAPGVGNSLFEQGLGLFGSLEDSALLDEVVSMAYQERHRPSRREPSL